MFMSISPPTIIFFFSILLGFFWGIFWDINRVLKKLITYKNKKFVFVLDVVFSIVACILTIFFFYSFTYAGFRLFVLFGAFLGFIIYYCTIQKPVFYALHIFVGFIVKIIFKILKIAEFIGDKIKLILESLIKNLYIKIKKSKKIKINGTNREDQMQKYIMKKIKKFIKQNKM